MSDSLLLPGTDRSKSHLCSYEAEQQAIALDLGNKANDVQFSVKRLLFALAEFSPAKYIN
jgi:hypothetical protein